MAKETVTKAKKKKECTCGDSNCSGQSPILKGFKIGFGFWLAGLLVLLIVAAITTAMFYLI